ncbi:MAG TPA: hypothetical protein VNA25_20690 [Phycisphaerae bacterium]|nr:hypothetical protein [Phycisphaerae bacterium]
MRTRIQRELEKRGLTLPGETLTAVAEAAEKVLKEQEQQEKPE